MSLLAEVGAGSTAQFPIYFTLVYVVGFIAAVTIGSIAWYNSKRPPGWENAERPNIVPKIQTPDNAEAEDPKQS